MLNVYRRHKKSCRHRAEGRSYRRCHCPIWVEGHLSGQFIRQSLHISDWQKAQDKIRKWEAENQITQAQQEPMTVSGAWDRFLQDARARNLREPTIKKYGCLRRQMEAFADHRGIRFIRDFDLAVLHDFRASWTNKNLSALKKLELLRCFFRFVHDSGWTTDNPARKLKNPKVTPHPTLPFTQQEVVNTLAGIETLKASKLTKLRLRALVLLLRFSGLRIGDAVMLARNRIVDGKLFLYTSKAGTPVYCPLPDAVLNALDALPASGPYYFWTGQSKPKTAISHWQCELQGLFTHAKVEDAHAHRFRDTFATELLLQGVPLERVSILLGHSSIRVTEKHYSPWIRSRQEQLEADVRRTWASDLLAASSTNRTRNVHAKGARLN